MRADYKAVWQAEGTLATVYQVHAPPCRPQRAPRCNLHGRSQTWPVIDDMELTARSTSAGVDVLDTPTSVAIVCGSVAHRKNGLQRLSSSTVEGIVASGYAKPYRWRSTKSSFCSANAFVGSSHAANGAKNSVYSWPAVSAITNQLERATGLRCRS